MAHSIIPQRPFPTCGHCGQPQELHDWSSGACLDRWPSTHYQETQAVQNPYDHESSSNGCFDDCSACIWARNQAYIDATPEVGTQTRPYSVLLQYPDTSDDMQTWYGFVDATNAAAAVRIARQECLRDNGWVCPECEPYDLQSFPVLLVIYGHHLDQKFHVPKDQQ